GALRGTGEIGPLLAISRYGRSTILRDKGKGEPVVNGPHAGGSPSANEEFKGTWHVVQERPSTPDRQIIGIVQFENLRDIEGREALIKPWLIGILGTVNATCSTCEPSDV